MLKLLKETKQDILNFFEYNKPSNFELSKEVENRVDEIFLDNGIDENWAKTFVDNNLKGY